MPSHCQLIIIMSTDALAYTLKHTHTQDRYRDRQTETDRKRKTETDRVRDKEYLSVRQSVYRGKTDGVDDAASAADDDDDDSDDDDADDDGAIEIAKT